jgi:hypothetical protein
MTEEGVSRKLVSLSHKTIRRLDDYRFGNRIARESEALRQLIEIGLEHVEGGQNRPAAPTRR